MSAPSRHESPAPARRDRALYVEILIRAPLETVWRLTQDPDSHVRWDARFTAIRPLHRRPDGAQEFDYELDLRVHTIRGTGVSLGTRESPRGERTSALVFDSADRLSPLQAGRGYWRYIPADGGVRFITGYDYTPGWGRLGRILDRMVIRRFVWWLTARSFDRLRMWAEDDIDPERLSGWRSLRRRGPRARRCRSRPPHRRERTIMQDAPDSLEVISS
ncbi:SRPBCC family protein [Microbacterium sp. SSW1-49]|uniref:SRPBCC family protein n=1 Tax=Microbacterium croceum TaxID=2851645 RepID=A0ABT0FH15_9MICO|nr:SRPBCC family protein [Microbacterium croceum]MCK2037361.1 SRPBCC family protein [Microbacterium croceum]